eukprot:g2861.t1
MESLPITEQTKVFEKIRPWQFHTALWRKAIQDKTCSPPSRIVDYNCPCRVQGRALSTFRPATIHLETNRSSSTTNRAVATIGATKFVCEASWHVAEPSLTEPTKGFLDIDVELGPICSPRFLANRQPSEYARCLMVALKRVLIRSGSLNLHSREFCIEPSQAVWMVKFNLVCLDFDGAAVDCAMLAILASLHSFAFPPVSFDKKTNTVYLDDGDTGNTQEPPQQEEKPNSLLQSFPFACTFALYHVDSLAFLLSDPCGKEENLITTNIPADELHKECCNFGWSRVSTGEGQGSLITVYMNENLDICGIDKPGNLEINEAVLEKVFDETENRVKDLWKSCFTKIRTTQ